MLFSCTLPSRASTKSNSFIAVRAFLIALQAQPFRRAEELLLVAESRHREIRYVTLRIRN